jgi:hypothetical protein
MHSIVFFRAKASARRRDAKYLIEKSDCSVIDWLYPLMYIGDRPDGLRIEVSPLCEKLMLIKDIS